MLGTIGFIGFLLGFLKGVFAWLAWLIRVTQGHGVKAEFGAAAGIICLPLNPRKWPGWNMLANIPHRI
jgi:hypothetical protein